MASRQKRSAVWTFFSAPVEKKVECKHCRKKSVYTGGTTVMREHLKRAHPLLLDAADESKSTSEQNTLLQHIVSIPVSKSYTKATSKDITGMITDWLISDLRPLSVVSDCGFVDLMSRVAPGYVVPSRTHITKLVGEKHVVGLKDLSKRLQSVAACSLTTDAWTSKATQGYTTVTVHFLTDSWEMESAVIETTLFPGSHTGDNIAEKIWCAASRVDLTPQQVQAVVHDEARNAELAGRLLTERFGWQSVTCAAHLLQTCVRHVLDGSKPIEKLLSASRKLVGHFRHSSQATEALLAKQVQMGSERPQKLVQDVPTRWNSAHDMLKRLVALHLPLMAVLSVPGQNRSLLLKDTQWTLCRLKYAVHHMPSGSICDST